METSTIKDVVAYSIKTQDNGAVGQVQSLVKECLQDCPGFISVDSWVSLKDPGVLIDIVTWKDQQSAETAQKLFETHQSFPELMKHLDEMKFSSLFSN